MDVTEWKQRTADRLQRLAHQMRSLVARGGPGFSYGALAAASILPVVAAASQGDYAALVAATGVVGGVGGNLIANQIQAWKDRSEAELAPELAELARRDENWRSALDKLLQEHESPRVVQAILSEADRDWFVASVRKALAAVGSGLQIDNQGVLVLGDRNVSVGGSVHEAIVVTGDNNSVNFFLRQYLAERVDDGRQAERLRQQIAGYLNWVRERYGVITLRSLKRGARDVVELELDQVYVPLSAVRPLANRDRLAQRGDPHRRGEPEIEAVEQTISLSEVLAVGRRLVVTGGPGCGKTTVLQHIAWTLATAIAQDDPALAATRLGLKLARGEALPLPIYTPLSSFARYRRAHRDDPDPHRRTLAAFISSHLIEKQAGFDLPADFFARLLREGRSVLLLLDGLDEVADEAERAEVSQAVKDLATGRGERLTIVVAVRSAAWHGATVQSGFQEIKVQPLTPEHIKKLVGHAYRCIYPNDAEQLSQSAELVTGIERLEADRRARLGKDAPRLIDSPLLVRMLIVVHLNKRTLPEHRAELYIETTETLIAQDHDPDLEQATAIAKRVGGSRENHRELVQYLAHSLHQRGERQGREIEERDLRAVLSKQARFQPWVQEFIDLTCERGTLLEERDRVYRFIHLAFQEFLAARYLAEIVRDADGIVRFFAREDRLLESWWREPALLTIGYLGFTSPTVAEQLIRRMAGLDAAAQGEPALTPDLRLAMLETAGAAYLELPSRDEALQKALARQIATCFADAPLMNAATPRLRAAAGRVLARLGDPRIEMLNPLRMEFIEIPAGPFLMGEGKQRFTYTLPYSYRIARYPVSEAQYQAFVAAGGYRQPAYWPEAAAVGYWKDGAFKGRYDDAPRRNRYDQGEPYTLPNHPVMGVSWYEALAFCRWLTQQLAAAGRLPAGHTVCLPNEPEWERAAAGTNGRAFPWGDKADPTRANCKEAGIRATSALGCFAGGASLDGVEELSGNVWEWTRRLYAGYPYPAGGKELRQREDPNAGADEMRVLRGGSYIEDAAEVGCGVRVGGSPDLRNDVAGVRVLLLPPSPSGL